MDYKSFRASQCYKGDLIRHNQVGNFIQYYKNIAHFKLFRILSNGNFNLKLKLEERKKKNRILEKIHRKEYRTMKTDIKRKQESLSKIKKRACRDSNLMQQNQMRDKSNDISIKCKLFENQEKQAVRQACLEERGLLCDVAVFLKQLLKKEGELSKEANIAEETVDNFDNHINGPHDIPDTVMNEILDGSNLDILEFNTPATSINGSLRGSRCNSFSSLNTSRPSSPLCIIEQNDMLEKTRSGPMHGDIKRKSQFSFYGNSPLNEGISSAFANPFYVQVRSEECEMSID